MFEQAFKNIDDVLWKEAGCTTEQTSWLLFLNIGQIFAEIKNKISSGYNLRNVIDHIDELRFRSQIENLADLQPQGQMDVIVANPPFGGKERKEVQQNFPIRTGETAFLFLRHFIRMLKAGGRAGVVSRTLSCRIPITPR